MNEHFNEQLQQKRLENNKKHIMTAQELFDKLKVLIDQGHGDAMIEVDDNCGGYYPLSKETKVELESLDNVECTGKWVCIE